MEIVLGKNSQPRNEPMSFTHKVISALTEKGIDIPLLELDDENDNLFVNVRSTDYLSGFYIQIAAWDDEEAFSISYNERGHSGGDPSFGEGLYFPFSEQEKYVDVVCEYYIEQL